MEKLPDLRTGEVGGTSGVGVKSYNPRRTNSGEAPDMNVPDSEGREPGSRNGLDTRVVLAVNDAD